MATAEGKARAGSVSVAPPPSPAITYGSATDLMAHGPQALHRHVASRMEQALGQALPQLEVRFQNLSLGADLVVADEGDTKAELPTITNHLKKKYGRCGQKKTVVRKQILKNLSGVLHPGTMTLILGQPGSGKSALMKVLGGRFPIEKNIVLEGDISYNGTAQAHIMRKLPQLVSYVTQRDTHFPMLTVRETLEFAHTFSGGAALADRAFAQHFCNGSPEENRRALEAARAMNAHMPDLVVQQLGLDNCVDTVVGDNMLRGISGGERKRVTTGEMEFGNKAACMLDEISTGLDSAATFDIVSTQRSLAKTFRKTIVMSLLQPAPEVFEQFDSVILLNEGEVLYHGPRDQVVDYFRGLGFVCPPNRDVADFLVDLSTDKQKQYEVPLLDGKHPRLPSEYSERFVRSRIHADMLAALNAPLDPARVKDAEHHFDPVPEFQQSFWASTATLMRRQIMVTVRNKAFLRGKAVLLVLMGLLYASVFWQFDFTDVQVVMGIIFFSIMYLALAQTPMLPVYFAARDVFYKQRRANFYRTSSYVVSMSVSQIPLTIVESLVFGSFVYWMCGFVTTVGAYLLFELILFLTNLTFSAFFFYIACATTDVHVAKPLAMVSLLMAILFAGFVVTRSNLPDYFIWLYWLDPISWGIRSLAISQYRNERFEQCVYEGVDYCATYGMKMGEYYLSFFDIQTEREWIYYGIIFSVVLYIICMLLAYRTLEYKRIETPENIVPPTRKEIAAASGNDNYQVLATPKQVEKTNDETRLQMTSTAAGHTRERNFVPVTVAFVDLWYTVPDPKDKKATKDLLKGISGFARPGKMTALMGASGAGKTTLMDVIAGRKTGGKARGQILLNGFPATDLAIRRSTGYCEQMDIHSDAATIREALTFSAFLRQGSDVSTEKKLDSVQECLELLDLDPIADYCVRGATVEQLKRLTIGVELAAQPSVIFLDEPTSGLDARAAKVIMDGVRKVANSGRTILCTIHQPSTEVFMLFDSLLLLKRGGETVFFGDLGERASNLINYFEEIPGVPAIQDDYNPATWMLEVIGAGVDHNVQTDVDFVDHFQQSPLKTKMERELNEEGVSRPASGESALSFSAKRASSSVTQARMVLQRFFRIYWRLPTYSWTRMAVNIFMGILFGLVFVGANYKTYQEVNSGLGMVFCTTAFLGIVALNSAVPVASEERQSFYRERASQTYNSFWYFVGFTAVEIPYTAMASLLFSAIFYFMAGFTGLGRWAFYWLNMTLHVLCQVYLGQLLSFAMPSVEVAALLGVLFNSIFVLFMGFNPPASSIPHNYKWLFDITPQRYSLMLFSALLFGECSDEQLAEVLYALESNSTIDMDAYPAGCQILENAPAAIGRIPIRSYLDAVFDIRYADIGYYMTINIIMIAALRLLALLALRFINHQKK